MHRKTNLALVFLSTVVLIWMSAGIASAQAKKLACVGDSITAFRRSPSSTAAKTADVKRPGALRATSAPRK